MAPNNRNHLKGGMVSAKHIMGKFNVSYQTVNHYTDCGLLPVSAKVGNVRLYNKTVVEKRLKKVKELVEEGYSLRLIRKRLVGI